MLRGNTRHYESKQSETEIGKRECVLHKSMALWKENLLQKVAEIKREKAKKENAKEEEKIKQQEKITAFHQCKEDCLWQ